eukprot:CAMPEP_0197623982 /NCGR_PEP_ID=MMETSP1338-20131121/3825_2 /TAXON_ID=43686 ORGANISM="Pelagodinium beii, Strain RCC1491" /NCGR_SAMPLE_ID=MMETSP1338 /ASSEMBLY_ACC=CAM_ASM_000754 /LENGTH=84 /DNA_ID=CAMNT_0043194077 /DNA_START=632 /DNA_END=886 /DNA_ORIENTATION=-
MAAMRSLTSPTVFAASTSNSNISSAGVLTSSRKGKTPFDVMSAFSAAASLMRFSSAQITFAASSSFACRRTSSLEREESTFPLV